ncbi:kinase-like protein [Lophiostoma macrostomum CBS 122681]|uniref:Kinase-like protein n=1 Tax=Lophiostoma macrostomum CBS 122681 TaxID=1314788 RepID=A0A6A6TI74_9PLEO|nr:kinase-like protein [Lophiostoma macrostomum CBS 122681]
MTTRSSAAPLTTESGLAAYLTNQSVPYTSITLLTGGTANYVFRVTLSNNKTLIYKHAEPYLSSSTSFAFDPTRMDYENRVLEILPPLLHAQLPESKVHAVSRNSYDQAAKLLCIEDGGDRNLKVAYEDPELDVEIVGKELAKWAAALHTCSTGTSLSLTDAESGDLKANNPVGIHIYRHSYRGLHTALSEYGYDAEFGGYINEQYGSLLATDNECVCHGDLWPGNVLVKFDKDAESEVQLTIVDWEMTRRGTSATDVAQFAAEAFLLDRFWGGRGFLPVFLDAYVEARHERGVSVGKEWVRRMAVHWAVHIAYWPTRVEWVDREGRQKLVDIGVKVLKAAVDDDWEKLKVSELLKDVGESWTKVWEND